MPRTAIHSRKRSKRRLILQWLILFTGAINCINTQRRVKELSHRSHKHNQRGQGTTSRRPWLSPPGALEAEAPTSSAFLQLSPGPHHYPRAASLTPTSNQLGGAGPTSWGLCKLQSKGCGCCRRSQRPRAAAPARPPSRGSPELRALRPRQPVHWPSQAQHGEVTREALVTQVTWRLGKRKLSPGHPKKRSP